MKAVVVGATGSLGRELAEIEARHGHNLILIATDERDLAAMCADLEIRHNISAKFFSVNLLKSEVLPAYVMGAQRYYFPIGYSSDQDNWQSSANHQFNIYQINFFSIASIVVNILQQRDRASIDIIGFGSIAETRGRSNNIFYSASKRALTSFFESLLHAQDKFNVRTFFYQIGYMKSQQSYGKKLLFPIVEPKYIAEVVYQSIEARQTGIRYLPGFWRLICLILRIIPWPLYRKIQF